MSKTGLRGLVEGLFGKESGRKTETQDSLERAAGVTPTEHRPPGEDALDHGEVQKPGRREPGT
ncbi:hypothetical protein [Lutibaculum baratangense]|uniref:Uncharacterized protein n=1 Tax=Lutibaculum baratangense AMV1 TaxID=631454 RepID=V4RL14_9HYPH|nr:hypothetical protein [Lutibaculum baratangense]ESR23900.1 hypothetical protein N177_2845 [Lutibaculum baratangense AMV1]